ncbi:MAG TPA: hypothetical protein VIV60_11120 [Polyangiaceae bacterium]
MSIAWSSEQLAKVARVLKENDVDSSRCAVAAKRILPVARELDPNAIGRRCTPRFGRFVDPKRRWFYHATVRAALHYVDSLTGPFGTEEAEYLQTYWADDAAFHWDDLTESQLKDLAP